jgi:hypothetical protein
MPGASAIDSVIDIEQQVLDSVAEEVDRKNCDVVGEEDRRAHGCIENEAQK